MISEVSVLQLFPSKRKISSAKFEGKKNETETQLTVNGNVDELFLMTRSCRSKIASVSSEKLYRTNSKSKSNTPNVTDDNRTSSEEIQGKRRI